MNTIYGLNQTLAQEMIQPGVIFLLPVPFTPFHPSQFLIRKDSTKPREESDNSVVKIGNVWINNNTFLYHSTPVKEIVGQAKVRPFLVVRRLQWEPLNGLTNHVIGLPIVSGNKDWMNKIPGYLETVHQNQKPHLHLLDLGRNPNSHLDQESIVVVCTPYTLSCKFFTHLLGYISQSDWEQIRGKLRRFLTPAENHIISF